MIAASALNELVEKISARDDLAAYKQLFIHYHRRLTQFSFSITGNKESAEEVVSDVFIKIWSKRKTLGHIDNLHLYLYVSTKNLSINYLQKQNRHLSFSLDESNVELSTIYFDPEQMMITAEMFRRLNLAVQELPPKCRLIFK